MGALLESGLVGNIGLKHLKVIKEDTINKWDKLGFLEGLKGHVKENMAQLYENQASHLINEAASSDSSGSFETVVFPIVRRVFSKLLANDIVSVQAMNLPIGKLFFFIPKIQERTNQNAHLSPFGAPGGPTGTTDNYTGGKNLYDRFYEDGSNESGMFDYSKGKFTETEVTDSTVMKWNGSELVEYTDLTGVTGNTVEELIIQLTGFTSDGQGKLTGPDGNQQDTEEFLASLKVVDGEGVERDFRVVTQKYGKGIVDYGDICDGVGNIILGVDLRVVDSNNAGLYLGVTGAEADALSLTVSWRNYETLEFEDAIGEVSFDLESVTVSVTERKLRAQWSPELAQDVSAFHNIDAEAELTALLSEQVAAEIDREILRDLRKGAAWSVRWNYDGWRAGTGSVNYNQKDWNQTLITAINQVSAQIHKSTLRGGANWIVVSSEVSAIFDDLEYFHVSNAAPEQDQYNMGIERVGTLSGRYQVYRDPYFPPNTILMGHKGSSLLDTGYVYAPYVPLQLTPTMYNPFNFTPIKGIMTRYAKKMVNNRFYGKHVEVNKIRF
jgi:hypothetical protein